MAKNRLQLNFQLESAADRTAFVQEYLAGLPFTPTADELETISNYILWGKSEKGKNAQQEKDVELKRWAAAPVESLDALLELPGFSESALKTLRAPAARVPRIVFDRDRALQDAPEWLRAAYEELFRQIDTIELILNFYELWSGRRKLPPRASLLSRFTEQEATDLNERALKLSQFKYLKLKHLLVELRAEQYTYQDSFSNKILSHTAAVEPILTEEKIWIGEDVQVRPLGLKTDSALSQKIFGDPRPGIFTDEELKEISNLLWEDKHTSLILDFTEEKHLLNLFGARADLYDAYEEDPYEIYGPVASIVSTLKYYEERANLTDLQKDLLELKLEHKPNSEIATYLNNKYDKSYNDNYISTIFHQKIIPSVANAARQHRELMENIFFPENFKKCRDCGQVLLICSDNFVRQKKSSDGFSPRCKACEKKKRSRYK